jgi:hypothetical protein
MGQGDVPTSRGGPLRRRREKRQLEHLAASSPDREGTPRPAAAHVRVIEDRADAAPEAVDAPEQAHAQAQPQPHAGAHADAQDGRAPDERSPQPRTGGFHVRAVPIDQPLANEDQPLANEEV